jgi:hypothetical protein
MNKFVKGFLGFVLAFLPSCVLSQSSFVPLSTDYYHLIERTEIKSGATYPSIFGIYKPYTRQQVAQVVEHSDSLFTSIQDKFNQNYLKNDNWEFLSDSTQGKNKNPLFGFFFNNNSDTYSKRNKVFDFHFNPVIQWGVGKDSLQRFWQNTRGLEIHGTIDGKIGFYTQFTENQNSVPDYLFAYYQQNKAIPGEGHFRITKKNVFDYLSGRGYFTFNASKHINVSFGHDRMFSGVGIRSIIQSDYAPPALFLAVNTQIGKFQYVNRYSQLTNYQNYTGGNLVIPKKYLVSHQLNYKLGKRTEIGVIENVVLARENGLDLNYLNPLIFYRLAESYLGSPDNAMIGLQGRRINKNKTMVYGQFMFDELIKKELFSNTDSFYNKWAMQLGIKAVDFLTVNNLDLGFEYNRIRPYTYSHYNTTSNYIHYNHSMAHPMGANLNEWIVQAQYQIRPKTTLYLQHYHTVSGLDKNDKNFGANPRLSYNTRVADDGINIGQGLKTTQYFTQIRCTYQMAHDLNLDFILISRKIRSTTTNTNSLYPSLQLRWNNPFKINAL